MDQLYAAMPIPSSDEDDALAHTGSGLDVSAHSSGAASSPSASTSYSRSPSRCVDNNGDDAARSAETDADAREGELQHHEAFTTASPPHALCAFLQRLLLVAEELHARLERVLPEKASASAGTASRRDASAAYQGVAKLRGRLRKETDNVRRSVAALRAAGCTGEADVADAVPLPSPVMEAAVACAQCNSMAHFDGIVTCLERESDVTGVFVPVSGNVGPPQRAAAVAGALPRSPFSDDARIEVDVVSCSEHRWIKVKTATRRNLALEAAALELNGSTPFTDMLLALVARARRTCMPHRRTAVVAVVLLHPPPPALQHFFASVGVSWATLAAEAGPGMGAAVPRPRVPEPCGDARGYDAADAWLPRLTRGAPVVCLDTTALVTLTSQSCFADGMPVSARLARLAPFHVLREQQRKEAEECRAVVDVMEPALRSCTTWLAPAALSSLMRAALLRRGPDDDNDASTDAARRAALPAALVAPADLSWLPELEAAARARPSEAADADALPRLRNADGTASAPLEESALVAEFNARLDSEPAVRPNWVVADITYEEFRWILETIAGPQEVARAARLLRLVSVVDTTFLRERMRESGEPDVPGAPPHDAPAAAPPLFSFVEYLRLSGKVSLRNRVVFGLADAVDAAIVTSNEQLCHAAREQGVRIDACFHPSRSLTEQKMYRLQRRHGPGKPPSVAL